MNKLEAQIVVENTGNYDEEDIEYILETYERGGIKYVHKIFAEDEIIDLFNINVIINVITTPKINPNMENNNFCSIFFSPLFLYCI